MNAQNSDSQQRQQVILKMQIDPICQQFLFVQVIQKVDKLV